MSKPIEIEILWRCSHCGHRYEQSLAVCSPNQGSQQLSKKIGSGALICHHCGQMGPMQLGCAIVLGMSVMAGSDGAVHVCRPVAEEKASERWTWSVQHPSKN
ncbi:MAG: hypothetical protein FWC56_02355 [Phycisphaerae bacterium]|nr:hypothetical protein [Phycisphaerae bacterium]